MNPPSISETRERARPQGPSRTPRPERGPLTERQRRLRRRALPLGIVALAAFVYGAISAAGSPEQEMAERFVDAWARQDFAAMHEELSPAAQEKHSVGELSAAYLQAQEASTATAIDPGDAEEPSSVDGTDGVEVEVGIRTRVFGKVDGALVLPLDGEKIDWEPHLTFPDLEAGERVGRRLTLPRRASILAKNGTPLARGPVGNRSSPLGSDAVDVAGETGTPDPELRRKLEKAGYPANQQAGVSGLELAFNPRLSGRPGGELLAVPEGTPLPDVPKGVNGRVLASATEAPGEDVRTTIERGLQETTVSALGGRSGGIVVLDARDGEVLALAGSAYSSPQPPGSIFKVITTTAGLEKNEVKLNEYFEPVSEINPDPENGARVIENNEGEVCGGTFVQSFAHSCNTVFAPLGADVGEKALVDTAERYGFNQEPTLFNAEATATVEPGKMTIPTKLGTATDITATAIGQGRVLATPLGMASVAQTVAAGGRRSPTPIVVEPELRATAEPVEVTSAENARVLTGLMRAVVSSGTGVAAALPKIQVAGKTGTAELGPKPG
ncbi:MAG TPA: penicillin-binding transpeptidase domain-containing protein, partial [Solirubrobacterales bacterium]|nr:penicillin-binding transpeptidase domain-containing protein [Solirubrobacterales bacterium]